MFKGNQDPARGPERQLATYVILAVFWAVSCLTVSGQTPGVTYSPNLSATLVTVDTQTNVYANSNATIFTLNGNFTVVGTNTIATTNSIKFVQRDAAGNYYLAGIYPGTPGFPYGLNYPNGPACFLTKYSAAGDLIWNADYGPQGSIRAVSMSDLQVDPASGVAYVGYVWNVSASFGNQLVAKFDASGSNVWTIQPQPPSSQGATATVRLGGVTESGGYVIVYISGAPYTAALSGFDSNGVTTWLTNWVANFNTAGKYARPVVNALGEVYTFVPFYGSLIKWNASGGVVWSRYISNTSFWPVGPDQFGGVNLASDTGTLSRYDYDGNLVWTINCTNLINAMILDPHGNRFFSMTNGVVGRIGDEAVSGPVITNAPGPLTVLAGSNVVFTVGATGSDPIRFFWRFNNQFLPNQTNTILALTNVSLAQAGNYSVVVSNFAGSVTSAPALLRVKQVELFLGNQLLTNGTYAFATPPTLSIRSTFTNGSSFYTLDGSAPSYLSTYYSAPFTVSNSATVRAIGYSADFNQSEQADTISVIVFTNHTLTATTAGGGNISLNPPGGTYVSTNVVTATATASNGWTFLYWQGDASGTNASVNILMERDKAIQAVFGTSLSTTAAGNGQVQIYPSAVPYPYGSVARLTGVPQPGNYFVLWGNAASGNTNPLYFSVTSPNQTVSSLFATTPSDQASLTILISGRGTVTANPRANVYPTNQTVTLTASPDAGQRFLFWSGDASGTSNPLSVAMNQSRVITANFSSPLTLALNKSAGDGLTTQGFRFTLVGDPQMAWQIQGSSNLTVWQALGTVTNNTQGQAQFTDAVAPAFRRFYRALLLP